MMPKIELDETFLELMMDDVQETIQDALKSRRKRFEQTLIIQTMRDVVTITVTKVRP